MPAMTAGTRRIAALFVTATIFGGFGGFVGSVLGNGVGALFAGGFVGGVLMAPLTAVVAKGRGWIHASRFWPVTGGAALGFLAAATLAVNTLSSPVGPLVAATLTGLGAVAGARLGAA
jgi:hypothetical protein